MPTTTSTGSNRGEWLMPWRFTLLLLALMVVSFPQIVSGLQTFVYRDFGIFSYPLEFHFRESFWRGELPLWNPLNCCGIPFLAQWNTQVLYPPALFYLLLPISWALGVFCLLHLVWGGLGMFLLAERWTGNRLAAGYAGIVFAFGGLMLSSLIWPSTIAGLAWMPWVVRLSERAWRDGGKAVPVAAFAGACQMLSGGVEAVIMCWVLLGALCLMDFFRGGNSRIKMTCRAGLVVALVAGLSAAQLLPFFELLKYSRMQQVISAAVWPMPPDGLANFILPLFHCQSSQDVFRQNNQNWTSSYYVGVVTVALAVLALWHARREWRIWPMAALAAFCLILALGDATPVYPWLTHHFNVVGLMRFPVKFVILPVFVLPLLAAFTLSNRASGTEKQPTSLLVGGLWLCAFVAILVLTFLPEPAGTSDADKRIIFYNGVMRAAFCTAILAVWFWTKKFSGVGLVRWQLLLLLLVWGDLFLQMPLPHTISRAAYEPRLPRHWTTPERGAGRVQLRGAAFDTFYRSALPDVTADFMGRRFAMMSDCNLLDDTPKCDGFYPLYPSRYAALFYNFYHDDHPADALLNFLGVSDVLVSQDGKMDWQPRSTSLPLLTAGQGALFADDLVALEMLTNADFNPQRVVILPTEARTSVVATNAVAVKLDSVVYADQTIEAHVDAPAASFVVVAQTYYPEWRAYVDGKPARIWPANYSFQAFEVPAGQHKIKLAYEDRRFHLGVIISLCTLAGCLVCFVFKRKAKSEGNQPSPT